MDFLKKHGLFIILIGAVSLFKIPSTLNRGFHDWEQRGDAHFYAQCAKHYLETGEFRWFEIYPIALKERVEVKMTWTAIAYPWTVAQWSRITGLDCRDRVRFFL